MTELDKILTPQELQRGLKMIISGNFGFPVTYHPHNDEFPRRRLSQISAERLTHLVGEDKLTGAQEKLQVVSNFLSFGERISLPLYDNIDKKFQLWIATLKLITCTEKLDEEDIKKAKEEFFGKIEPKRRLWLKRLEDHEALNCEEPVYRAWDQGNQLRGAWPFRLKMILDMIGLYAAKQGFKDFRTYTTETGKELLAVAAGESRDESLPRNHYRDMTTEERLVCVDRIEGITAKWWNYAAAADIQSK